MNRPARLCLAAASYVLFSQAHAYSSCAPYQWVKAPSVATTSGAQSFLWRVRKAGVADSYLVGTFHSLDVLRNWEGLSPLFGKLKSFVSETDFSTESGRLFSAMSNEPGENIPTLLGDDLLSIGQSIAAKYGMDLKTTSLKPWALFLALARSPNESSSLDAFLEGQARRQSLRLVGLQSAQEMVTSIETLTGGDQLQILKETICNHQDVQEQVRRLEQFYSRDEVGPFLQESSRLESPVKGLADRMFETLVTNRNQIFMPRLEPELQAGGALIAVGAAHLFGSGGLVALLRADHFEVEPVDRRLFMQELLDQANRELPHALGPVLDWLKANSDIPESYVLPQLRLASSMEMEKLKCEGDCAVVLESGVLYVSELAANELKNGEPHLLSLLMAHLIKDVQSSRAPTENTCTYWQQKNIESLILRSKFLSSKGLPAIGLELLPNASCNGG